MKLYFIVKIDLKNTNTENVILLVNYMVYLITDSMTQEINVDTCQLFS